MNRKAGNKRPRPSYEEGKLRDPEIAKKQREPRPRETLLHMIKRAVRKP